MEEGSPETMEDSPREQLSDRNYDDTTLSEAEMTTLQTEQPESEAINPQAAGLDTSLPETTNPQV